jgi:hypothetical protein
MSVTISDQPPEVELLDAIKNDSAVDVAEVLSHYVTESEFKINTGLTNAVNTVLSTPDGMNASSPIMGIQLALSTIFGKVLTNYGAAVTLLGVSLGGLSNGLDLASFLQNKLDFTNTINKPIFPVTDGATDLIMYISMQFPAQLVGTQMYNAAFVQTFLTNFNIGSAPFVIVAYTMSTAIPFNVGGVGTISMVPAGLPTVAGGLATQEFIITAHLPKNNGQEGNIMSVYVYSLLFQAAAEIQTGSLLQVHNKTLTAVNNQVPVSTPRADISGVIIDSLNSVASIIAGKPSVSGVARAVIDIADKISSNVAQNSSNTIVAKIARGVSNVIPYIRTFSDVFTSAIGLLA